MIICEFCLQFQPDGKCGFGLRIPAWEFLLRLFAAVAGTVFCLWTLRRYLVMLGLAEHAAERSVCEKCETYRGLTLSENAARRDGKEEAGDVEGVFAPVRVRCRHCRHEWTIG